MKRGGRVDVSRPYKVEDVAKEHPYLKTNQVTDGALSDSGQPEAALTKSSVAAARQSLDLLARIIANRPQKAQSVFGALKIALENIAKSAWDDKAFVGKFAFSPSRKLSDKLKDLLGHDINEIAITADSVRHMKNHHGDAANEAARGQAAMTQEDVAVLPYVLNNFDVAERNPTYDKKLGNKSVDFYKRINGVSVVATISMGKEKQFVVSGWKVLSAASMSPTAAPKLNALNDADIDIVQKRLRKSRGLRKIVAK